MTTEISKPSGEYGMIFDIQKFSVHDGPGIRTTVFFKGCPLKCLWCSNPESQKREPQMMYFIDQCQQCYRCVAACPKEIISVNEDGTLKHKWEECDACGKCVDVCIPGARSISGKLMSVDEVYEIVNRDRLYYRNSGGGVTFGGGEPTMQSEFLINLLKKCYNSGIHTNVDTSGYAPKEVFKEILKYVSLIFMDIKHMDPVKHKELTGVDNGIILENVKLIKESGVPMHIRVPLIPGLNDSDDNLRMLAEFLNEIKHDSVDLLVYHRLGVGKYKASGMVYQLENLNSLMEVHQKAAVLESEGLKVAVI
jgi:pyruvate formate lyase activating enzyme